jgi:endonuclease YncB( thermonuclease family)
MMSEMRILAALFSLSRAFSASFAETLFLEGYAGRAADGDTFTLMLHDGGVARIRPSGADAPERRQPTAGFTRPLGSTPRRPSYQAHCYKKDRDRRDVCRVYVQGRDVALEQVEAGYAWWFSPVRQ